MAGRELPPPSDDESGEEVVTEEEVAEEPEAEDLSSANRYRTQRRGGKGVIDIKTSKRNGRVVGIVPIYETDEVMMMTMRGKIQRIAAKDISVIGRNTQGVRIMSLDEGDSLTALVRVPYEEIDESAIEAAKVPIASPPVSETSDSGPDAASDLDESDSEEV
jgi:DNA gyrase subunit A